MTDRLDIGHYVANEIPPPLVYRFETSAGDPIDLTGYTASFHWQPRGGDPDSAVAQVTDGPAGEVTYVWAGGELQPGSWKAEFVVTNGTNTFTSHRLLAAVRAPIDVPA